MKEHRFAQVVPGKVKEQTEGSFINSRNTKPVGQWDSLCPSDHLKCPSKSTEKASCSSSAYTPFMALAQGPLTCALPQYVYLD